MKNAQVTRVVAWRLVIACAILGWTSGLALADTISVHTVFYIDESCKAYALDAQHRFPFGLRKTTLSCLAAPGALTIFFANNGNIDYTITTGDIELLEEGHPTVPSDVLKISRGNVKDGRQTYLLKFYSDTNEGFDEGGNHERDNSADIGFDGVPFPNPRTCTEGDLTTATANWRLDNNDMPDPNRILATDLNGATGCAFVAYTNNQKGGTGDDVGSVYPEKESPIGYVIVSDTVAVPEPSSILLFGTAGVCVFWRKRRSASPGI